MGAGRRKGVKFSKYAEKLQSRRISVGRKEWVWGSGNLLPRVILQVIRGAGGKKRFLSKTVTHVFRGFL